MVSGDGPPEWSGGVQRRRFLSMALGGAAGALAGCSSPDSSGDDGDEAGAAADESTPSDANGGANDTDTDGEPAEGEGREFPERSDARFQIAQLSYSTSQIRWNPLVGWFLPQHRHGTFAQWTQYLVGEDRFHPHLIQAWEHRDGRTVLALDDAFTWAKTGRSVTAEDLAFQLDVYGAADHAATRFVEDATATDEFELTVGYSPELNPELLEYSLLGLRASVPPSNWEDTNWEAGPAEVEITDPDASGPILQTFRDDTAIETTPRLGLADVEDHPIAHHYNWNGYRSQYWGSSEQLPLESGTLDGMHSLFAPESRRREYPSTLREITFPAGFGMALWFDHDREPWDDPRVRRAFLHTLDREAIVAEVGEGTKLHHPAPTGLSAATLDSWFGTRTPEELSEYEGDRTRAESLLAEAGYDPDERDISVAYPQGWSDWAVATHKVIDQLGSLWSVSGDARAGGPSDIVEDGEFDVVAYPFLNVDEPMAYHPYFAFERLFEGDPATEGHFANYDPGTVEVGGEGIDPVAELHGLRTADGRDEQRPHVRRLARVVNEDVPCAIVMEKREQSFVDTERFAIPEESPHLRSRWPQWWLPKVDERLEGATQPGLLKYDPPE